MGQMFTRLFSAFTMLFMMIENIATAGNSLTVVARETAGDYEDDSIHQRKINRARKYKEYKAISDKEGIELNLPA
jgi:hypothetical protein